MNYLGGANKDERGQFVNGAAGDQTGAEVYLKNYYNYPWTYFLEPKDVALGNRIANAMIDACNNNHIGYDMNQRNTAYTQYKKYGSLAKIATNCETDCSALTSLCITEAGVDILSMRTNAPTTSTLYSVLISTGKFKSVGAPTKRGTVCLKPGHHVEVFLGNSKLKIGGSVTPTPAPAKPTSKNIDVTYRTKYGATWLPWVKNKTDYAGLRNKPIIALQAKVSAGKIKYRVFANGKWSAWAWDGAEANRGGAYITAVEMYLYSPNSDKCIHYRVSPLKKVFYSGQIDNNVSPTMDGYAGDKRNAIDRIQMWVE